MPRSPLRVTFALSFCCLVGCLLVGACSGHGDADPREPVVEVLDNGAVRVRNAEVGIWGERDGWRLVEDLRIGAADGGGPDMFGGVFGLSMAVDGDGQMFVLDGQAHEVRVFDASGAHARTFGREGAGPGELRTPSLAGWGRDGNLWVVDPANARYSVFTASGEFLTSVRRPIAFSIRPWPGTIDLEGRIVDVGIRAGERSEQVLVRFDPSTAMADTFAMPGYDGGWFHLLGPAGLPMQSVSIPFAGRLIWQPDPRGHVWSAITDDYRVVKRNLEGDTLLLVERVYQPLRAPAEERDSAIAGLRDFIAQGGRVDASKIPRTRPALSSFLVDDRGHVWVMPLREGGPGRRAYDVFDPEGRYLGEVPAPTPVSTWPRPVFRAMHLYGFTLDSLHVPYLVRLRIEGRDGART